MSWFSVSTASRRWTVENVASVGVGGAGGAGVGGAGPVVSGDSCPWWIGGEIGGAVMPAGVDCAGVGGGAGVGSVFPVACETAFGAGGFGARLGARGAEWFLRV
jgi:hypothetical protein